MNIFIYDCEILRVIPRDRAELEAEQEAGCFAIQYCKGWDDFEGMGISCLCLWDYLSNADWLAGPRIFLEDNLPRFRYYLDYDLAVGFNSARFDRRLVEAQGEKYSFASHCADYDILREMWIAEGLNPDRFNPQTHGGFSLQATIAANFPGLGKTGSGAMAPIRFQAGYIGEVIDYCMHDVMLTKLLFDSICRSEDHSLIHPKNRSKRIALRDPFAIQLKLI